MSKSAVQIGGAGLVFAGVGLRSNKNQTLHISFPGASLS